MSLHKNKVIDVLYFISKTPKYQSIWAWELDYNLRTEELLRLPLVAAVEMRLAHYTLNTTSIVKTKAN